MTVYTNERLRFSFPAPLDGAAVSLVFSQGGKRVLEFTDSDPCMTVSGKKLTLELTPEDTARFSPETDEGAVAQFNILKNGKRRASCPIYIRVHPNLKAEKMEASEVAN